MKKMTLLLAGLILPLNAYCQDVTKTAERPENTEVTFQRKLTKIRKNDRKAGKMVGFWITFEPEKSKIDQTPKIAIDSQDAVKDSLSTAIEADSPKEGKSSKKNHDRSSSNKKTKDEKMDLPKDSKVIVVADSTTNVSTKSVLFMRGTGKTDLSRTEILVKYRSLKKYPFYLEFNLTPSIAGRKLRITQPQFSDYPGFDKREQREYTIYGFSGEVKAGVALSKHSSLYLSSFVMSQGFRTLEHTVNWETGLADVNSVDSSHYSFKNKGFGFGFSWNPVEKVNAVTSDIGFYFSEVFPSGELSGMKSAFRKFAWGGKFSVGYKRTITTQLDLRIMPTLYTNFTHINHIGTVNTRLFNLGMTAGFRWYFEGKNAARKQD